MPSPASLSTNARCNTRRTGLPPGNPQRIARGGLAILCESGYAPCRNRGNYPHLVNSNPTSGISAGCHNGQVWVRVDGKGSHQNSRELKAFVQNQIQHMRGQRVIVDLSLCTGMDSTFMGMLTCISTRLEDSGGTLHVIHAAGRNAELLRGLGLDAIFTVDDGTEHLPPGAAPECTQLAAAACGKAERTELCLESHEALAAADTRNAVKFRDVIELMRSERRPAMAR
jgi:anti-sigma B factor antagonist